MEGNKPKLIVDEFISGGNRIAIINNEAIEGEVDENALILMKMEFDGEKYTLKALTEEEYERARKSYNDILDLIKEEGNNE